MSIIQIAKKLVLILATFMLITFASMEVELAVVPSVKTLALATNVFLPLKCVLYIHYLVYFRKNKSNINALINFKGEVNIITPFYAIKLGFRI